MATRFPMLVVNTNIPLVVQMTPNPKNISIDSAKQFSKTNTLGGWVFEHFGEQPSTLKCSGKTIGLSGNFDNELSVEAVLFRLQQIYRLDKKETFNILPILKDTNSFNINNDRQKWKNASANPETLRSLSSTFIYYKYDVYTGFFTHFHWSQDAETTPRHYEYDFEFLVLKSAQNMLADAIFAPATGGPARAALSAAVGLAASVPGIVNTIKAVSDLGKGIASGQGLKSV